jgi:vanillate O-demethylase monooxygenase subunit
LAPPDFLWTRIFDVFLPFAARLVVHFPGAARLWILNAPSPMSARLTRLFSPVARNFDKDGPVEAVQEFNRTVFEEDKVMIEMQRPLDLPLDPVAEGHISADRSSITYRRLLKQVGLTLRAAVPSDSL